ncbi:MAG: antitoxin Xre/MbcA/ParS toxin-binding domain-containing protein [Cocleimonas sp.]
MSHLRLVSTDNNNPNHPEITEAEAQAMQRAVINLFERWKLTESEAAILLGGINPRTFHRWKNGEYGRTSVDLNARMSNLMGIHKALRLLFKDTSRAYEWMRKPNTVFADRSALDILLNGAFTDLMRVRHYLDAQRG